MASPKTTALFLTFNLLLLSMLAPNSAQVCTRDALTIRACANVLNLVNIGIGGAPAPCCTLIQGLVDLEAAACLCAAIRVNVLGINININLLISALLNGCGSTYTLPSNYVCA